MNLKNVQFSAWTVTLISCASIKHAGETKLSLAEPEHCIGSEIHSIELPIYPGNHQSAKFTYRFKYSEAGDRSKPVIIFLPGGPGYPSMDESQSAGIPSGYRYLLTDQRGTGCNNVADSRFPTDSLTSENMAEDVVAVIKSLHLDTYIIYGHSFGTIHATKVIAKIENEFRTIRTERAPMTSDLKLPKALVLEGTIGKAFLNGSGLQAVSDEWDNVRSQLPSDVVQQLSQNQLPFSNLIAPGKAPSNWGAYIRGMLNLGQFPPRGGFGDLGYSLLALQQANSNPSNYNSLAQQIVGSTDPGYFDIFLQVDCAELYDTFHGALFLQNGKLKAGGPNLCAGRSFVPYNSAEYYISTPIFYLQGAADPATPLWQAQYHFRNHGAAPRTFVELPKIGHFPLQRGLFTCKTSLWEAIAEGSPVVDALRRCPLVKSVEATEVEANATELHVHWN